ncbi:STAS domain-containing protein [Billgrantia endophytica]|uniref:Anti-sigma factor antagonist n=1 Tax=Billgrantia endophytica TaxID=2033802 RepID=A0A2N7U8W6_9GAMM|nr:STAS domain-containing protein [Halomonas endophytica]PMR76870.1 anti-sigma factor antagonist [Halomonas endophytica]
MSRLLDSRGISLEAGPEGLVVTGEVDFGVATELAEAGSAWLKEQPAGARVTLDLCGVEQVSSAALTVLLEWTRCARAAGVKIRSVRLSAPLARLTRVAGLDTMLPIDDASCR